MCKKFCDKNSKLKKISLVGSMFESTKTVFELFEVSRLRFVKTITILKY